ncbi:LacI family DNA-binding transcriptional regulator [Thalassotalea euphylliae]|uniref:LacI family DNA-binding transcriptional regulator n=1 Tax=Thalassotalea euphylliae TaxID=1655234 RepID=A0A3E0TV84_9GAMM|nr:LacI family DNA-binding transcriptional regulator [Thalassotalea euphylliae]REL28287.1 LacI family DNA-binding transcriptional regulator [Thalassotalea euphylliae]
MATIKDVAKEAGVSIATVSRVINNVGKVGEKTRSNVIAIMNKLGYTPDANARALKTQKSSTIGVVIPDISDPFFSSLANGVEEVASSKNMQMLLSTGKMSAESELKAINLLVEQRCDAIVLHSKFLSDDVLVSLSDKIPGLIFIDRFIDEVSDKCIWLDNFEGGKIAARHLLALEHKNVAFINSNYDIDDPKLRLGGFEEIVKSFDLSINSKLKVNNEPTLKGGELAAQELLAQAENFTSVFAYNDAMAIGAISVFEDNGYKVPNDISIIGFDDVLLSKYSRPKLTTLRYPIAEMANHAAQRAIDYSSNDVPLKSELKYIPSLVKRESTTRLIRD